MKGELDMIVKAVRNKATEYVPVNYTFSGTGPFCCDEMGAAFLEGFMNFGYIWCQTVHVRPVITQCHFPKIGAGGWEITFCPYCGKKITIEIKERENADDQESVKLFRDVRDALEKAGG